MGGKITEEMIRQIGDLAKLPLTAEEQIQGKDDMQEMLVVMDCLQQLDTEGIEPMTHVFPVANVFREDVVTNKDGRAAALRNAPDAENGFFRVPGVIE